MDLLDVCYLNNLLSFLTTFYFLIKAVCYLNSHGKDFEGGLFHFKAGEPSSVVPVAGVSNSVLLPTYGYRVYYRKKCLMNGTNSLLVYLQDVLMYTADSRNIHSVDEVPICLSYSPFREFYCGRNG